MIIQYSLINNLIGSVVAACMIGMMFGTVNTWTSPVIPKLLNNTSDNPFDNEISSSEASWISSLTTLGACIGCWIFGYLCNSYGRKWTFCSLGIPIAFSFAMMIIFPKVSVFYAARFITGLAAGGGFILINTYVSEITSKSNRGVIMTICGMSQSIGCLLCYSIGPWIPVTTLNLVLLIFPIAFVSVSVIFCEESPYFYLLKNNEDLAKSALITYRPQGANIDMEIAQMKEKIKEQQEGNLLDVIKTKAFFRGFVMANMLLIFQQLTGITCVLMYSQTIFDLTGSSLSSSVCSIILGALQLLSGCLSPVLTNKFNIKSILIVSGIGMIISEAALGTYCVMYQSADDSNPLRFLPILTLATFIFSYNFGFGPLCWLVQSEVFATRIKTMAISFSICIYFMIGFLMSQYFNAVVEVMGIGPVFLIFAGFCITAVIFIYFYVIETKGKSMEEIQDILKS